MNTTRIEKINVNVGQKSWLILSALVGYSLSLLFFLFFAADGYDYLSRVVAWLILLFGTLPMLFFLHKKQNRLPVIEVILLAYVNAFSLPVFFETVNTLAVKKLFPEYEPVSECLFVVLLAIFSMVLGFKVAPNLFSILRIPKISLFCDSRKLFNLGVILSLVSLFPIASVFTDLSALYKTVFSSDIGLALIALLFYSQILSDRKRIISIIILVLLILKGLAIGMTQHILQPVVIWLVCRWIVTRKFEIKYIALCALIVVLIQPVKLNFRGAVWGVDAQSYSSIEKIVLFSDFFYDYWFHAEKGRETEESVHTRTSLLLQTSHVIDWTPNIVPYKNGKTFYFMLVTWIPRFIWADKPTAQQSNIDYAIDYGVTSVEGAEVSMFGVGHIGEVIMNFGILGIFPIFILLGVLSYFPVYVISIRKGLFMGRDSSIDIAPIALSVSVLFKFIMIGSTVADSYGGMVQLIIVQGGMLYFFARARIR